MDLLVLTLRIALASVLVVAGIAKALDLVGSRRAVRDFGLPRPVADVLGTLLPVAELLTAGALLAGPTARVGGGVALLLFATFTTAVGVAVSRGETPQCHCFGQLHSEPAGPATLARNALLSVAAVVILAGSPGRAYGELDATASAVVVGSVAAAVLALLSWSLWNENRRLRAQVSGDGQPDLGLEPGTPAPDLELRSLARTGTTPLASLLGSDRPTILVQVSPFCGPCAKLMPELARWDDALEDRMRLLTVSAGDEETNREFARAAGLDDLRFTEGMEVGTAFRALVTPSAILIDEEGRVAGRPVAGAEAIEALVRAQLRRDDGASDRSSAFPAPEVVRHSPR